MHARAYSHQWMEHDSRTLFLSFAVSIICHLVFFAVLISAPSYTPKRIFSPSVINVSIVTLPGQKKTPAIKTLSKTNAQTDQKFSKTAPLVTKKKKIKTSLKKKTFKSSKIVKSAIERIEKKVEESRPTPVTEAIEDLKHKIEKGAIEQNSETQAVSGANSKRALELIDIYRVEIAFQIQKNWAFSEQIAGSSTNLQACLVFKVMPSGEIREIFFTDRSGNSYLDESAYRAIIKSNPDAPHPPGVIRPFVEIGLRFGPQGLQ